MSAPEPWQRQSAGWGRQMYGGEVAFAAFATHENGDGHSSLSTHATYSPSKPCSSDEFEKVLRKAWIGVRFNLHPMLAAVSTAPADVLDTEGYSLFYPDVKEADVEMWADKTVYQHDSSTNASLVASLKRTAPTARDHQASIHFAPSLIGNSFHVVLVAGHWLTDGRGAIKILNYILNNLNTAVNAGWHWGEEAARLSIPLPVATGRRVAKSGKVIPLPTEEVQAVLSMIIGGDLATQPAFSHPQRLYDTDRSEVDSVHDIRLSPLDSKALLDACRAHHVSVTALLNVLLSMAFVGEPAVLAGSKTVPIPFFSTHRGHDLLEEHKQSVGLQLVLAPFGLSSELLRSCWITYPSMSSDGIWRAARESKRQLVEAVSHDIGLTYEHEIICAILPSLIGGTGAPFYQAAVPFVTSVGKMTELFVSDPAQHTPPTWTIDDVANSFTVRWFRPVAHYWEWKGETTVRIVASAEYDKFHSVVKMKEDILDQIRRLIQLGDL